MYTSFWTSTIYISYLVTRFFHPAIPLNLPIGLDFLLSSAGKLKPFLAGVTHISFCTFIFVS